MKPEERITTIITYEEQMRGWLAFLAQKRTRAQHLAAYARLQGVLVRYQKFTVLPFDERAADEFDR